MEEASRGPSTTQLKASDGAGVLLAPIAGGEAQRAAAHLGKFDVYGLAPGDYQVYLVRDMETIEYRNPERATRVQGRGNRPRYSGRQDDRYVEGGGAMSGIAAYDSRHLAPARLPRAWAQTYTIAGIVKNDSGRPAKRVRVAVASEESRENQTAVLTGEDGRFRFDGLAAGKYQLTAEPPAGGRQPYGTRSLSSGFGTAVAAGPEFHSDNLVFQLIAPGAIGGRVLDAEGEPAENVLVQLFAIRMLRGKRSVLYWGSRRTDDRGEYRFGGIADGAYYLAASGQPWYAGRLQSVATAHCRRWDTPQRSIQTRARRGRREPCTVKPGRN